VADLEALIHEVPDFPAPGIVFRDITPLLADPGALVAAADQMAAPWAGDGIQLVVGVEARGFLFGPLVAERLGAGVVPVRKPGKLPRATVSHSYDLEYGTDILHAHADAVAAGQRVLVIDDVLATGGTASAVGALLSAMGASIAGFSFLVELPELGGRGRLEPHRVEAVVAC
jgi:adenine phosphoribosyltransferase